MKFKIEFFILKTNKISIKNIKRGQTHPTP